MFADRGGELRLGHPAGLLAYGCVAAYSLIGRGISRKIAMSSSKGSSCSPVEPQSVSSNTDAAAPERPPEPELSDLSRKAADLLRIEQGKGMVMGYYGMSADVALAVLRRWSIRSNTELSTVCTTLVAEGSHAADLPSGSLGKPWAGGSRRTTTQEVGESGKVRDT